ncbi:hypothetical protein BU17DRAFT_61894 [Hysterangium stoloniferum]|nr:hypothetical protein BU17DRAFT_61894 [Hysterangium stoloniferum]
MDVIGVLVSNVTASAPSTLIPASSAAATAAAHLQGSKYLGVGVFTMLVFEHLITFADEVERIWKQPRSLATVLFVFNRYGSLLQRPVIVASTLSPAWSRNLEKTTPSVIMILRVWALWHKDKRIIAILSIFWIFQVAFSGMALGFSKRVPFPPFLTGCILTGNNTLWTPFWLMPLLTDTTIFSLTLLRYFRYSKEKRHNSLLRVLIRDGMLYYLCIFGANLLNVLLFLAATEDLKAIGASFSQVLTSIMVSRLVLNLRNFRPEYEVASGRYQAHAHPRSTDTQGTSRIDNVLGILGEEADTDPPTSSVSYLGRESKQWRYENASNSLPMTPLC